MNIPCHVSRSVDMTIGIGTHTVVYPPPATPAISPSAEMITPQMWTGFLIGKGKFTTGELAEGLTYTLAGHDVGPLIPDITQLLPPNPWYAVMYPFASRKMMFSASRDQVNNQPTACAQLFFPPFPMLTCSEPVSIPLTMNTNMSTARIVNMSLGDVLMGALKIFVTMAIDLVFYMISRRGAPAQGSVEATLEACRSTGNRIAMGILGKLFPPVGGGAEVAKQMVSALANYGISELDHVVTGANPTAEIGVDAGIFGEAKFSAQRGDQGWENRSTVAPFGQSLTGGGGSGGGGGGAGGASGAGS